LLSIALTRELSDCNIMHRDFSLQSFDFCLKGREKENKARIDEKTNKHSYIDINGHI